MSPAARDPASAVTDALTAAAMVAVDPAGLGGLLLRVGSRTLADLVLAELAASLPAGAPVRRLPASADAARLDGGVDVAATLAAGRTVRAPGLMAEAAGGLVVVPMAERLEAGTAARLARAIDGLIGETASSGDGAGPVVVAALDEGRNDDPPPPASLTDRLALQIDLSAVMLRDIAAGDGFDVEDARRRLPAVMLPEAATLALADAAAALGLPTCRPLIQAARAARAHAALAGRDEVAEADLVAAARLVLAPRARRLPTPSEAAADDPPAPPDPPAGDPAEESALPEKPLADVVLEAAAAALPADLLARLIGPGSARPSTEDGRGGPERTTHRGGGRPLRSRAGKPGGGVRLDLVETLRVAAPLQRLRGAPPAGAMVAIRPSDLRVRRFRRHSRTTTVFVVDASGSSALHRLAEAKGAVELVLADAYVRRDRVAMISFRGKGAEPVLPPTASLTLARRRLQDLPAGGGTPLAAGIDAAAALSARIRAEDGRALLILLTDGQANVARDGAGGRARAEADALAAAALVRAAGIPSLTLDISDRPSAKAAAVAEAMGGGYLPLPRADASRVAAAVRFRSVDRRG